jgi:hypothetical protein
MLRDFGDAAASSQFVGPADEARHTQSALEDAALATSHASVVASGVGSVVGRKKDDGVPGEAELIEYNARTIQEIRTHNDDVWPWVEFMRGVRAKRVARARLEENLNAWREMALATIGVPVTLHNKQASAKKRVVRRTGGFSALDDSDSE